MAENVNNQDFNSTFDQVFKSESEKISAQLSQKIMIALVGDVNSGKSSTN
ncbi:hypothetical protein [Macrococcus equipercicus]|nr:hypothetical protein [Macrococcus equipercicus]